VSRARWVILTPSQTEPEWRQRVTDAVAAAGLTPVPWTAELGPKVLRDPKAVVLADSVAAAREHSSLPAAVVFTDPESSVAGVGQRHQPAFPEAFWLASLILAEGAALPASVPVLSGAAPENMAGVEVLPGVRVTPPPVPVRPRGPRHAATALRLYLDGRPAIGATATVSPTLFLYDARGRVAQTPGAVEITGRARTLLYGPYLALPPGSWTVKVAFAVDDDAAGHPYRFEWGTGDVFERVDFTPETAGVFAVEVSRDWDRPAPAEARVILMRSAFAGTFRLIEMTVTRTA
jgi:hypothetical protein